MEKNSKLRFNINTNDPYLFGICLANLNNIKSSMEIQETLSIKDFNDEEKGKLELVCKILKSESKIKKHEISVRLKIENIKLISKKYKTVNIKNFCIFFLFKILKYCFFFFGQFFFKLDQKFLKVSNQKLFNHNNSKFKFEEEFLFNTIDQVKIFFFFQCIIKC